MNLDYRIWKFEELIHEHTNGEIWLKKKEKKKYKAHM